MSDYIDYSSVIGGVYLVFALFMVYQQFRIARTRGDDDAAWSATVRLYRRQLRIVNSVGIGLGVVFVVMLTVLWMGQEDIKKHLADAWESLPYNKQSLPLMISCAFTAALLTELMNVTFKEEDKKPVVDLTSSLSGQDQPSEVAPPSESANTTSGPVAGNQAPQAPAKWRDRLKVYWAKVLGPVSDSLGRNKERTWLAWFLIPILFAPLTDWLFGDASRERAVERAKQAQAARAKANEKEKEPVAQDADQGMPEGGAGGQKPAEAPNQCAMDAQVSPARAMVAMLWAGAFTFTLWFSYRAWIRSHIRSRMLNIHKFGPTIVPEFMGDSSSKETPSQVLLIGPKSSGKSRAYESCGGVWFNQSTEPKFANFYQGDGAHRKWVCIGDMPGENLGEQLYYIRTYRTTRLVLVVSAAALTDSKDDLDNAENYSLDDFPKLCNNDNEYYGPHAHDYFTALKLLLRRTTQEDAAIVREYNVQSFAILFNYEKNDQRQKAIVANLSKEGRARLAAQIGKKLGLGPQDWYRISVFLTSVYRNNVLREWFAMDSTSEADGDHPKFGKVVFGGFDTKLPRVIEEV
jgi:hypothetical protein